MRPLKKVEVKRLFERAARDYPPRVELAFLLQSLEDPLNVGSMFRIADACRALELVFTGPTPTPPHEEIDRTARGHERRVAWRRIGWRRHGAPRAISSTTIPKKWVWYWATRPRASIRKPYRCAMGRCTYRCTARARR